MLQDHCFVALNITDKEFKRQVCYFQATSLICSNSRFYLNLFLINPHHHKVQKENSIRGWRKVKKRGELLLCVLTRLSELTLCIRTSTESGLMPSALHRSVMVNLRVKGTRKGQAGRFIGKEYKVHTLRPDWVTFTFLPGPPHQQLNFFSPHTKFLEMLGLSAGHKGYTHFNVL